MERGLNVPEFGNWEIQDIPYTAYFEKARRRRTGEKLSPNDTQDNPNMFSDYTHPAQSPTLQNDVKAKATRSRHESHKSREDGNMWRLDDSSLQHEKSTTVLPHQHHVGAWSRSSKPELQAREGSNASRMRHELRLNREYGEPRRSIDSPSAHETVGRRASVDLNFQRDKRSMWQSTGPSHSIEHSPLHPHYQPTVGGKISGVSSEGGHGLAPSTPGKSRMRTFHQGNQKADSSVTVPKFGDWDESNPSSADQYTHIFSRVRDEKQSAAGTAPAVATEPSHPNTGDQYREDRAKRCCCFPWGGK